MLTKHILCSKNFYKNKNIKETEINTKEYNNRQNVNIGITNWDTNRERKEMNISERTVYRRILGSVLTMKKKAGGY